jgi:ADP-L-glycero-D-manno-heptose 6-epimerase
MSKPIIVTGAAGFIGRNAVAELNRRGRRELILADTLGTDDKWQNLVGLQYEDLVSPQLLLTRLESGQLSDAQAILHLGACTAKTEQDADYLLENNYRYTRRLCEYSLLRGIRMIYASSAATYGDGSRGYSDEDEATTHLQPLNMYGYSKHMFDLWALESGALKQIVGLKYFNVFGPFEDHKGDMKSLVAKSFRQIRETGRVRLFKSYNSRYADGEQMRDFIYVKDAVDVTLSFLENLSASVLCDCSRGEVRAGKDLGTEGFNAIDLPVQIEYIEMPEVLRGKYQYFTQAEMGKLHLAGYEAPFHSLEDAIADYIESHLMELEQP